MQLENLHFLNLRDDFQLNTIWHKWSTSALIICRRLAESEVNVMPSITCMDW